MPRILIFLYAITALLGGASLLECYQGYTVFAPLYAFLAMSFGFAAVFITIVWLVSLMNEPHSPY